MQWKLDLMSERWTETVLTHDAVPPRLDVFVAFEFRARSQHVIYDVVMSSIVTLDNHPACVMALSFGENQRSRHGH